MSRAKWTISHQTTAWLGQYMDLAQKSELESWWILNEIPENKKKRFSQRKTSQHTLLVVSEMSSGKVSITMSTYSLTVQRQSTNVSTEQSHVITWPPRWAHILCTISKRRFNYTGWKHLQGAEWVREPDKTEIKLVTDWFSTSLNSASLYGSLPYPSASDFFSSAPQHGSRIYILQVNWGIKNADPIKPLGS